MKPKIPTIGLAAAVALCVPAARAQTTQTRAQMQRQTRAQMQTPIRRDPSMQIAQAPGDVSTPPNAGDAGMVKHPQLDTEFVDKAALAGKSEVEAGRLALERSSSPAVRSFATRMVHDHTDANERLARLAGGAGIAEQSAQVVDPVIAALRGKRGHDFDVDYVAAAGPGPHEKVLALFRDEAHNGRDAKLRAFANAMLPTLEQHLAAARKLAQEVGAP